LISDYEGKISIKKLYLEEILIDEYKDKIIESTDKFDWQFTDNEKELLTQYCQANRLIVECLNNLPSEVREEIEETLLLPLEEIEKWKQQHRPNNT
ncbi:hypothetical protein AFK68_12305, partial [Hydrocoleum sp. CS-953]|uniref:NACHT C-terminal helical domain 2-containing protein n=1 Tax=Hydrocoleum sp. CS-953 TaxID=1671698 RepID=UPI000BCD82EF